LAAAGDRSGELRHAARGRALGLVVDDHRHRAALLQRGEHELDDRVAFRRGGIDQAIERFVAGLGLLVAEALVQHPAQHEGAAGRTAEWHQLALARKRRHAGVNDESVLHAGLVQRLDVGFGEQGLVAQFDRVRHSLRQGGEEPPQQRCEQARVVAKFRRLRWELQQHGAELLAEPGAGGCHAFGSERGGVEVALVGSAVGAPWRQQLPEALHQEPERRRHLGRVVGELARFDRRVERAVDADRAQQRVLRVGGEPVPAQLRLLRGGRVDEAAPAGEVPRRRAEPQVRGQSLAEPHEVGGERRRLHARGLGLVERAEQAALHGARCVFGRWIGASGHADRRGRRRGDAG
jgi:hypothetical protein